jgi:hypothetical protein
MVTTKSLALATMSNYCRGYEIHRLRAYPGWSENTSDLRREKKDVDGKEVQVEVPLTEESILYLHDSYIVTHDVYNDRYVIFDNVTDEWKRFCHETLGFEIPNWETIDIKGAEEPAEAAAAKD